MATSSILDKIVVNNPKILEELVANIECSVNDPIPLKRGFSVRRITDTKELKRIMQRGIQKWGLHD